jgi:sulfoxide reductase heme-binding subunit YedZ
MARPVNRRRLTVRILTHHLPLAVIVAGLLAGVLAIVQSPQMVYRLSMATAYVGLALLAAAMLIGPINFLSGRPTPISTDLRRDIGIWAGLMALAHVVVGLQVHMGNMWLYFFRAVSGPQAWKLRNELFGWANYTGLAAGIILLVLLLTSNDLSLRRLGPGMWKRLQQTAYIALVLSGFHGVAFQIVENRAVGYGIVLGALLALIVTGQCAGVIGRLRRQSERASAGLVQAV